MASKMAVKVDNCFTESKNKSESIHIEAARVITGATKLCSMEKLFVDLGWEYLQNQRDKHKLGIFLQNSSWHCPKESF